MPTPDGVTENNGFILAGEKENRDVSSPGIPPHSHFPLYRTPKRKKRAESSVSGLPLLHILPRRLFPLLMGVGSICVLTGRAGGHELVGHAGAQEGGVHRAKL